MEGSTPTLLVKIDGTKCRFIIDTGSNVSLIQPRISGEEVMASDLSPFGVTGDVLEVKGTQVVTFHINNVKYEHGFLVCSLPTTAAGIVGMDFLLKCEAEINFGKAEIKFRQDARKRKVRRVHGVAERMSSLLSPL